MGSVKIGIVAKAVESARQPRQGKSKRGFEAEGREELCPWGTSGLMGPPSGNLTSNASTTPFDERLLGHAASYASPCRHPLRPPGSLPRALRPSGSSSAHWLPHASPVRPRRGSPHPRRSGTHGFRSDTPVFHPRSRHENAGLMSVLSRNDLDMSSRASNHPASGHSNREQSATIYVLPNPGIEMIKE